MIAIIYTKFKSENSLSARNFLNCELIFTFLIKVIQKLKKTKYDSNYRTIFI